MASASTATTAAAASRACCCFPCIGYPGGGTTSGRRRRWTSVSPGHHHRSGCRQRSVLVLRDGQLSGRHRPARQRQPDLPSLGLPHLRNRHAGQHRQPVVCGPAAAGAGRRRHRRGNRRIAPSAGGDAQRQFPDLHRLGARDRRLLHGSVQPRCAPPPRPRSRRRGGRNGPPDRRTAVGVVGIRPHGSPSHRLRGHRRLLGPAGLRRARWTGPTATAPPTTPATTP